MKEKFLFTVICYFYSMLCTAQSVNNDAQKSYINIAMPKTPESQAFEKYGNVPVNEFSGTASISIPITNIKGKFIESPVTLSYHPSGIKVNQEATWVGLGFDLQVGGRITVETKGNVDDNVRYITENPEFKTGIKRLFNKWHSVYTPNPKSPQMGYAFLDYAKANGTNYSWEYRGDTLWDDNMSVTNSAWFGSGEPDVYHANFLGNSLDFYFDIITGQVKYLGEKSLYSITNTRDNIGFIKDFRITDNSGVQFFFEQKEKTKLSVPANYGFASSIESTTAWLLTKVVHPSLDTIVYTYTNYGKTHPAFTWSASASTNLPYSGVTASPVPPKNFVEQEPYLLTKIESANTVVDFINSNREDLRGQGAKKLDRIEVKDKVTGAIVKQMDFVYEYFTGTPEAYENSLPDSVKNCYIKRLKLVSVKENNANSEPWLFYYNSMTVPGKMSFSQDHWGYYNGAANAGPGSSLPPQTSPLRLLPAFSTLGNLETRNIGASIYAYTNIVAGNPNWIELQGQTSSATVPVNLDGYADRNCNPSYMQAFMMDSIKYPTGGASKFEYEPHVSNYQNKNISNFVGGGLRIKSIKNYTAPGVLENNTEYDYMNSGIYLGAIEYMRISTKWPSAQSMVLSTSGNMNNDKQYVGYASVKKIMKSNNGQENHGYVLKYFKVDHPYQTVYSNIGHPFSPYIVGGFNCGANDKSLLLKQWSANAPTPKNDLDGKLYLEKVFNNNGVPVKTTNYYYRQQQQTTDFYSVKVADNYNGYLGNLGFQYGNTGIFDYGKGYDFSCYIKWRRWELCLIPAVSFYTLLDSVVESTISETGSALTTKQSMHYNNFFQQEYITIHNSDGTASIKYIKTPLSFEHPNVPSIGQGEALMIEQMKNLHMYNYPIEQLSIKKTVTGDSVVTSGQYNVYDYLLLKKVYTTELLSPLQFRSQFIPSYYLYNYPTLPSFNVVKDSHYKLQAEAEYTSQGLVKEITTTKEQKALLWDEVYGTVLAQCIPATSADIAFTSFETASKGSWSYSGAVTTNENAPTGIKIYSLVNGSISRSLLNSTKTYVVSYWSKSGEQLVSGSQNVVVGNSLNGFTYYEHRVPNPSSGTIIISGTGEIDELRLYPEKSFMTSYCYKSIVGVSSICDPTNRIAYYHYDRANRLELILDQDNNILKKICYNYAGQPENCQTSVTYYNTLASQSFTKNNCTGCDIGSQVTYIVPGGTYSSTASQAAADQLAQNDIAANGQAYANANGTCTPSANIPITYSNYLYTTGFVAVYTNSSGGTYTFNVPASGSGTLGCVPAGIYTINISKPGNTQYVTFNVGCAAVSGTTAKFKFRNVSSSSCNTLSLLNVE